MADNTRSGAGGFLLGAATGAVAACGVALAAMLAVPLDPPDVRHMDISTIPAEDNGFGPAPVVIDTTSGLQPPGIELGPLVSTNERDLTSPVPDRDNPLVDVTGASPAGAAQTRTTAMADPGNGAGGAGIDIETAPEPAPGVADAPDLATEAPNPDGPGPVVTDTGVAGLPDPVGEAPAPAPAHAGIDGTRLASATPAAPDAGDVPGAPQVGSGDDGSPVVVLPGAAPGPATAGEETAGIATPGAATDPTPGATPAAAPADPGDDPSPAAQDDGPRPAFEANAVAFTQASNRPMLAIIIEDLEAEGVPRDSLMSLAVPVTMALAGGHARPGAFAERGFETVAILAGPDGGDLGAADADNAADLARATLDAVSSAVAVMERPGGQLNREPQAVGLLAGALAASGHGYLVFERFGAGGAINAARSIGIPAGSVIRIIDERRTAADIRRALDGAALDASKSGAAIVYARSYPETISTLLPWLLGNAARSIQIAPLSATLTRALEN